MAKTESNRDSADMIRDYAKRTYVETAKRRGLKKFLIKVGEVNRALQLHNRVPLVCHALKSEKFLEGNALRLVQKSGPPSGMSTTVVYTYEFVEGRDALPRSHPLLALRGIARELFQSLGGGEQFVRSERSNFSARDVEARGPEER
jgi:hypothetical protein